MNSSISKILSLIHQIDKKSIKKEWDGKTILFSFKAQVKNDVISILKTSSIEFQDTFEGLEIKTSKKNFDNKVFYNIEHFLHDFKIDDVASDFLILFFYDSFLFYNSANNKRYNNKGEIINNYLIENSISSLKVISTLKEKVIADYVNTIETEIVFYSTSNGIFKLKYPLTTPHFDESSSIKENCDSFLNKISSIDFKRFFVNELFHFLKNSKEQYIDLITYLPEILLEAERNLDIYSKKFSFEKLKTKLIEEKDKYFENLREILGKVFNQLISIPISTTAVVFSVYKIDSAFGLLIILLSYFIYTLYLIHFLKTYQGDLREIETEFDRDFEIIADKSGLEEIIINTEEQKINRRIKNIKQIISAMKIAIIFFFFLILVLVFNQITISLKLKIILGIVSLILILIKTFMRN